MQHTLSIGNCQYPLHGSKSFWKEIGQIINKNKKSISLEFEKPPCYIFKYYAEYKAEEWTNWIILYLILLFKYYMQNK